MTHDITDRARHPRSQAELDRWLARRDEPIIDAQRPIVDAHQHFWHLPDSRYVLEDLVSDIGNSHRVRATVAVECGRMYRDYGPIADRPLGETEFACLQAEKCEIAAHGELRAAAAIVSFADLSCGAGIEAVLEGHLSVGRGRLRGIRQSAINEPSMDWRPQSPKGLLRDAGFREGFAILRKFTLSFDAWQYFHQLDDLLDLARAFPDILIVVNHTGGLLGVAAYEGCGLEVFTHWEGSIRELSACPNVFMKIGGLGMPFSGFGYFLRPTGPTSNDLVDAWKPYVETCVENFGAERCMFESNFPPDKQTAHYSVIWNAFKKLAQGCSEGEKSDLFQDTAARFYGIQL
jgi:predicted TIM-barrel fold metal-dependent hydrolase